MRCPKCNITDFEHNHAFCYKCGTQLEGNEETRSPDHPVVVDEKTPATNAEGLTSTAQISDVGYKTDVSLGKMFKMKMQMILAVM